MEGKRKLSEWIREGAKLRPQCITGDFYQRDEEDYEVIIGSCAFGAAFEAAVGMVDEFDVNEWYHMMEPRTERLPDNLTFDRMTMLNDDGTTREDIADWLEANGY